MDSLEDCIRRVAGLADHKMLHPALGNYKRLVDAISFRQQLVEQGHYSLNEIGVFARDLDQQGAKEWLVDTYAGFAHVAAPKTFGSNGSLGHIIPSHMYEVIVESEPCWLYFDLEYSKALYPHVDPEVVIHSFMVLLGLFCLESFQIALDLESILLLDSSTDAKFSKHVVVKFLSIQNTLCSQKACHHQGLAFRSNAHVGAFVAQFLDFIATQRQTGHIELAHQLFVKHSGSKEELSIIDTSVYSRNRCFRVLFNSKCGKSVALVPDSGFQVDAPPALHILQCLVSFVPCGVSLWANELAVLESKRKSRVVGVTKQHVVPWPYNFRQSRVLCSQGMQDLVQRVCVDWDEIRQEHESTTSWQRYLGGELFIVSAQCLVVTPKCNRFCLCKGASHKSNRIYLVVDCLRHVYYQKCHDVVCGNFRSAEFPIMVQSSQCSAHGVSDRPAKRRRVLKDVV